MKLHPRQKVYVKDRFDNTWTKGRVVKVDPLIVRTDGELVTPKPENVVAR